jgi:methionine-R-sulfoxide reductase
MHYCISLTIILLTLTSCTPTVPSSIDTETSSSPPTIVAEQPSTPTKWRNFTMPSDAELRKRLTSEQYEVTQEEGTETPFENAYWDNHEEGIYVDVVSGEPLFSSTDKYDSDTGWPSFTRPLEPGNLVELTDTHLGYPRMEIRSKRADSHLGHLFEDGPPPTGLRYCINSAALRFIPQERLEAEGYGEYIRIFQK